MREIRDTDLVIISLLGINLLLLAGVLLGLDELLARSIPRVIHVHHNASDGDAIEKKAAE